MLNNFEINILVVDDTPNNLRFLSAILSQQGYKVHKALNGRLAIMMCQSILPDLILLDIKMPNMNGYEVCQSLKANDKTREIPVIFISALNDVLDKVKAFEVGGVDYITKPFQDAEVLSRIENQLKLRSLQIKLQEQNVALQQEIQERQKAQEALELSETRNRALLNAIPDLMFRISRSGIFLDYRIAKVNESEAVPQRSNQVIVPVTDCLKAEHDFIGKKLSEVLPDDLAIWIMHYVEETLLTSQIQIGEYVQQVNGNWHAYEARYVKSGNDEVLGLVRDISERKRAEAERLQTQALLRMQKQQIEQALSDLKQAQSQLIQNETMVTLGQLVAGISHEINNPVNFIYGNVTYISEYIQDLVSLLELYQQEYPNPAPKVLKKIKDVDLDFVIKDVQNAIDAMYRGAKRIQQIVLSLRNFSRLDESEIKPVDIHEGIDSTLVMLQHRLRETGTHPAIEVIKEYSKLPRVTCYPSQLNQVFLHLLNNALDALESATEEGSSQLPTIRISTELVAVDTVRIRIADNGCGIPESARSRLFDPFFTTKPVGSGTGLGLSISYQIVVQQHRGKLTCCSSPGQGAEFAIEIPVTPTQ